MTAPTLRVEAGFGASPFAESPTWTTLDAAHVTAVTVDAGRRSVTETSTPTSTATVRLDNSERTYDPTHSGGPFHGRLTAGTPLRITAVESGHAETVVFRGLVGSDGWQQGDYRPPAVSTCVISCVDQLGALAGRKTVRPPFEAYIEAIAAQAGLPPGRYRHWPLDDSGALFGAAQTFHDSRAPGGHRESVAAPATYSEVASADTGLPASRGASGQTLRLGNCADGAAVSVRCDPEPSWPEGEWTVGFGLRLDAYPAKAATRLVNHHQASSWLIDRAGYVTFSDASPVTSRVRLSLGVDHYLVTVRTLSGGVSSLSLYLDGVLVGHNGNYPLVSGPALLVFTPPPSTIEDTPNAFPYLLGDVVYIGATSTVTQVEVLSALWASAGTSKTVTAAAAVLTAAGVPHTLGDAGRVSVTPTGTPASALQSIEATELGRLHYNHRAQQVEFVTSAQLLTDPARTSPVVVLTDDPDDSTGLRFSAPEIVTTSAKNYVSVTGPSSSSIVSDVDSQALNGAQEDSAAITATPWGEPSSLAEHLIAGQTTQRLTVRAVRIQPSTTAATKRLLAVNLFDRALLRRHPHSVGAPSVGTYLVEGRTLVFGQGVAGFAAVLYLAEIDPDNEWWQWGSGIWGGTSQGVLHP